MTVAQALVSLFVLATGPRRQELELYEFNQKAKAGVTSVKVGMVMFDIIVEEIVSPTVSTIIQLDTGGLPPSATLCAKAVIVPSREIADREPETKEEMKAWKAYPETHSVPLSNARWRHTIELAALKFNNMTPSEIGSSFFVLSLEPVSKKKDSGRLTNARSVVPLEKLLNYNPDTTQAVVNFECSLRQKLKLVARVQLSFTWAGMPRFVQMIGGRHHSSSGILGAELVKHVIPPPPELFKNTKKMLVHEEEVNEVVRDEADADLAAIDSSGEEECVFLFHREKLIWLGN